MTELTNYGDIQKVYSIWICNERIPLRLQNTVSMYSIKKTDMIGTADEPESDFDLMNVVIIRRGQKTDASIFDSLAGVFNCNKAKIMEYVNIRDNETVLKGVEEMGGLGQSIMTKGMQEGIERAFMLSIQNLVKNLGMTEEEAMEALEIPESEHEKYRGQM